MSENKNDTVFDPIRQKRVALTPEERVRQAFVHHLIHKLNYPPSRLANEYCITIGKVQRRCDTVVFSSILQPLMVIEYKAPTISLSQAVVDQAFRYNSVLRVPYIILSNGLQSLAFHVGYDGDPTTQLDHIPTFQELNNNLNQK